MQKTYRIAAISSNHGSFGHTGHVMVAQDGQAIEGLRVNGSWLMPESFNLGDKIALEVGENGLPNTAGQHGFELFHQFKDGIAPPALAEMVWSDEFPANVYKPSTESQTTEAKSV